ncbi:MAG TPA: hypothetical protein PKE38_14155 [Ignavibacteriaceae bacterium]|nr:hypothetical protein [Ignavibacteriaceae bacterium]
MKTLIKIIFIVVLISTTNYGQNIWSEGELDYDSYHLMQNLSVDSIKQIIINDGIEKPAILYISAVKYLYYLKSETQFLITNLNTEIDTSSTLPLEQAYWYKAYTNIFFMGLLGDGTSIEKMKIISNYASYLPRLLAINTLTEIGVYENYNFVLDGYNNNPDLFINILSWYGKDPRYEENVKSILMDKIAQATSTLEVIMLAIRECK